MIPAGKGREGLLLAAVLAPVLGLAWLDSDSEVSARLRAGTPIPALLDLEARTPEGQASLGIYFASYLPRERRLELAYIGPAIPERLADGLPPPLWRIDWEFHAGDPGSPEAVGRWIRSRSRDLRFWLAAPGGLRRLRRRSGPPMSLYDALRLAFEAYRLEADSIALSWLPEPRDIPVLLPRLLGTERSPPPEAPITVEVLNASGAPGVALQAKKVLRLRGLDVVEFRNAPQPEERTMFWDRSGEREAARRVAQALGCGDPEVLTRLESRLDVRVTAVLGRDYAGCRQLR